MISLIDDEAGCHEMNNRLYFGDDFVECFFDKFSTEFTTSFLYNFGLIPDMSIEFSGPLDKYVFLYGSGDEVYTKDEIEFISNQDEVIAFNDCQKAMNGTSVSCRVISAKVVNMDILQFCIALTKIVSKAKGGFNVLVAVAEEGMVFSCNSLEKHNGLDFYISNIIRTEEELESVYEDLIYCIDKERFADYYFGLIDAIKFREPYGNDSSSFFKEPVGPLYAYIDFLFDVLEQMDCDYFPEIERNFWDSIEDDKQQSYSDKIAEIDENLFKIESKKVNTLELLFDANDYELAQSQIEHLNYENTYENYDFDIEINEEELKSLLDDPESVIKLLKEMRDI